jgi:hypothetical protein
MTAAQKLKIGELYSRFIANLLGLAAILSEKDFSRRDQIPSPKPKD